MSLTVALIVFLAGLWAGYRLGIRRAETGIAVASIRRTWAGRSAWRR